MWTFTRHRILIRSSVVALALLLANNQSNSFTPLAFVNPAGANQNAICRVVPEMAPIPYHDELRSIQSGRHTAASQNSTQRIFSTFVQSLDAPWLQIQFGSTNLGNSSYLKLTSSSDGAVQQLDAATLALWHNQSAMFKGDAVKIELFAAPEDKDVFFEVQSLMVGEWVGGVPLRSSRPAVGTWQSSTPRQLDTTRYNPDSVCAVNDDRVASSDPAVGRIVPVGCTGWVISNGAFLTAGHCFTTDMTSIQFNVPASNADGTINPPPPNDQYPIDRSNVSWANNGNGDDWTVFRVTRNTTTTLTPPLAYDGFYRIRPNDQPATVRVTGYGLDGPAPCFGEPRQPGCNSTSPPLNADNQTQQTATGPGQGRTGDHFQHSVDTEGGNSGSPVRYPDMWTAVAIHTHGISAGTCITSFNGGTAFTNAALVAAINTFPGNNVRYVDQGYPAWNTEDGTVFRPFDLLAEGINSVTAGGIVSVVKGNYNEPMTINKNIILEAPVGTVVIGAP
jgi:V8-like Glu-specific endopeptidase